MVGRDECNTQPKTNCTAPNGFCEVAEISEGRRSSQWIYTTSAINPPPCGGIGIYIIINYSCLKALTLSGKVFSYKDSIFLGFCHSTIYINSGYFVN